jgi:hypothetical protein
MLFFALAVPLWNRSRWLGAAAMIWATSGPGNLRQAHVDAPTFSGGYDSHRTGLIIIE